jgi:hypothetical protein
MVLVMRAVHGLAVLRMLVLAAMLSACAQARCWAQTEAQAAEHQVKAAFLYKFLGFVEWPPQSFERAESPLVIGVLGSDALADELVATVIERTVRGHPLEVRKLKRGDSLAELHVLFVGRSDSATLPGLLSPTKGRPLLTVTESDEALAQGSTINFVVVDNKVRFDVALGSAEQRSLKISSRLLAVARKVLPNPS